MYLAAIEDADYKEEKIGCESAHPLFSCDRAVFLIKLVWLARHIIVWNDVYGFDYSPMLPIVLKEPLVDCVELKSVVTKPCLIKVSAVSKQIRSAIMIKCGKRQKKLMPGDLSLLGVYRTST
jgi:protein arginine N-methyltransferase 1